MVQDRERERERIVFAIAYSHILITETTENREPQKYMNEHCLWTKKARRERERERVRVPSFSFFFS